MMEVARPVKPPTSTKLRIHPSLVSKQRQQNQNQNQLVADLGQKASPIITTFCNGGTKRKLANPPPASSQSQQSSKRLKMLAHQSIKNKQEFQWLNDMFKCRSKQLQTPPPPPQDPPKSLSPNKQQVTSTSNNNIDVAQTNLREALRRCRETAQYKQLQQEQRRQKEREKDSEEKQRKLERERLRQEARVAMDNVKKTLDLEPSWSSVLSQLQTLPGFDAASWGCSLVDYNFYFPHRAGQPNYNY